MARPGIALQMYTVREDARQDFVGTIRRVAEIGYPAIELAGYGGMPALELKKVVDDAGLKVMGSHLGLSTLESALEREIEYNAILGNHDLTCPALPKERRQDAVSFQEIATTFNEIGRRCKDLGARFSYHIHGHEFQRFGDRTGMDILIERTDPEFVFWEPDTYWIIRAGEDAVAWIRRNAARCPLIHLKDPSPAPAQTDTEIGEGTLDLDAVFAVASHAEWYVVEQEDFVRPPMESVAISLRNLTKRLK
jgi:sugar phosphate isomerase/epimerase